MTYTSGNFYYYYCAVNNVLITFLSFEILFEQMRKQPPRPINEISVRRGGGGVPSWKMPICSRLMMGLLKNNYVFED